MGQDVWRRRLAPRPGRRRHAECKRSYANLDDKRQRRNPQGGKDRPVRSCSRHPCKPGHRARVRFRRFRE